VNSVSDKVVRHSLAYISVQKWLVGERDTFYVTIRPKLTNLFKTPISYRYSLVAPQSKHLAKKSAINTNRKFTTNEPKIKSVRCP